ncbi:unnamed protein product [Cercopithifilaria johnstoni]|uniref:BACK domain-containing protein n=1 Tax=Cercopithifilaria johnstoni TaxID=2874296 RepID=A0A8J2LR72_9BILA|nr:unnamed protein product [Cercopithifilaria johnstoni]
MWCGRQELAQPRQQLTLDVVWVVPGEIRKHYLQDEIQYDRLEAGAYINWSASVGLKNQARIVLENGYSCSAPASLLAAFSEILRKLILVQASREQLSSGKEITIRLHGIPSITNAGLYNVIAFIQNGQIRFLETELENILTAANDLRVVSLVSLICEEMIARILENTSTAISLLYTVVTCLPAHSEYRSMVVDSVARKFRDVVMNPEFLKLSFEMLYALISSPVIQGAEWVMEIYKAVLFWLRNNIDLIYFAPALLDNVNFKIIINTIENRREIVKKSMEVPELGPIIQTFLMDAIYAQFLDDLTLPPSRNQSLSSSIYTISGAETVNAPTPVGGQLGLAPSPLRSYVIPAFDSRSPVTTKSISNDTSASLDKNWCSTKQLPIGSGSSRKPVDYQSSTTNTATYTTQEKIPKNVGDSGRRLWSEVLAHGPKYSSESKNLSSERPSFQGSTISSAVLPSKSSHNLIRTARNGSTSSGPASSSPADSGPSRSGAGGSDSARSGPIRNGTAHSGSARSGSTHSSSAHNSSPLSGPTCTDRAHSRPTFSYSTIIDCDDVDEEETATAIATSPTLESAGIRTSSSQESASSSKRRRKFEQIPLRTEPPKSRKELRKERQARERAEKK